MRDSGRDPHRRIHYRFADTLYASLGSFCALIGFIIVLGSGLAEVLSQTKVAHNLVYMVVNRFKLKSKKMAILISMITSTLLVSLLAPWPAPTPSSPLS